MSTTDPFLSYVIDALVLPQQVTAPEAAARESKPVSRWAGTPEQVAFEQRVLQAHADWSAKRHPAFADLDPDDLATVAGTGVKLRQDAADEASRLLTDARAALAEAKQSGNADAAVTLDVTGTSGYRNTSYQETIWKRYFEGQKGYYNSTAEARSRLPTGAHGDDAVQYMANYIADRVAAPGFSKHQGGTAIDFWQERKEGYRIANSTQDSQMLARWRNSWFFHWLGEHAGEYTFQPYKKEPWHWTYEP